MVQSLKQRNTKRASTESFGAADLTTGKVVQVDEWVTIASKEGNKNRAYGMGYGPDDRRMNSQGWSDLDLILTSDGGTTNHPAQGKLRYAVYGDLEQDDLIATSGTFRAPVLSSAVSASSTDKVLISAHYSKVAGDASTLALQYRATADGDGGSSEDGWTVDADSASDYGMAVGQIPLN